MPPTTGKQRVSNHSGKASAVDNSSGQSKPEKETKPEAEDARSTGRASRATKSALLENPSWASLKPKSRQKSLQGTTKDGHRKRTVPVNESDRAEKRKRSGSAIEDQRPRPKKSKQAPIAPKLSHKSRQSQRRHRAPSIDANGTDENPDGNYNDSGDDNTSNKSQSSREDGTSSGEEKSVDIPHHVLQAEGAKIVNKRPTESEAPLPGPASRVSSSLYDAVFKQSEEPSRHSTPASDFPTGPPTSNFDTAPDVSAGEDDERQPSERSKKKTRTHREAKLEQERPTIRPGQARSQGQASNNAITSAGTVKKEHSEKQSTRRTTDEMPAMDGADDEAKPWKPRTKLKFFMKSKKTAGMGLKEQNSDIQKVIHGSYEFGQLALVVDDPDAMLKMSNDAILKIASPFGIGGLETIALASLIKAADSNGYDGEFDIAHRLEEGSESLYITPMVDYVSHRLSLIRSSIKKHIALIAPGILGLPTNTYQHKSSLLVNNSFIYLWTRESGFDMSKPFQNEVITKSVECAFFAAGSQHNNLGLEYAGRLASSSDTQAGQREVSVYMVVLASVAACVASIIQDTILGRATDFTGPQLDSLFKKLVIILLTLRHSKPFIYHRLMHGIYTTAVAEKPLNLASSELTAMEILGEVKWDMIDG